MPRLSIIVPVYQAKEYLEKCINSILEQSFVDFELILVDDGSDDGCERICNDYAKKDERVKIIRQENQGVSSARNTGLDYATGKYIAFVDADDWVEKDLFEESINAIEKSKADILYHGFVKDICSDTEKEPVMKGMPEIEGVLSKRTMKEYILKQNGEINVNVFSYIFRKKVLDDIKFNTNMSYAEDTVFVMQTLAKVRSYCLLKNCGYHYNVRVGSAAYRWQPKMVECYKKSFNEILLFYKSLHLSKQQASTVMAIKVMNGYATLIYNLCLPTCPLKRKEKIKILKQARKEFRVDYYKKHYKVAADSLFEKMKSILTILHLEGILITFGPLYCRRK